jgi:hypothetical protein
MSKMRRTAEVTPDANEHFASRRHFRVRQATQMNVREQFNRPKCVAPLEIPLYPLEPAV